MGIFILFFSGSFLVGKFAFSLQNLRYNIQTTYTSISQGDNLKQENLELKKKISQFEQELIELNQIRATVLELSEKSNVIFPKEQKIIYADVLDNTDIFIEGKKIINIGKDMGITSGDLVVAHGALVGEIKNVDKYTSELRLLSHNDTSYAVYLEDGNLAIISGSYDNQKLLLSKIPRESKVKENSVIKLAPTVLYPTRNPIIIGTIDSFINVKEEPYLQALVTPALEYKFLKNVFVIPSQ